MQYGLIVTGLQNKEGGDLLKELSKKKLLALYERTRDGASDDEKRIDVELMRHLNLILVTVRRRRRGETERTELVLDIAAVRHDTACRESYMASTSFMLYNAVEEAIMLTSCGISPDVRRQMHGSVALNTTRAIVTDVDKIHDEEVNALARKYDEAKRNREKWDHAWVRALKRKRKQRMTNKLAKK